MPAFPAGTGSCERVSAVGLLCLQHPSGSGKLEPDCTVGRRSWEKLTEMCILTRAWAGGGPPGLATCPGPKRTLKLGKSPTSGFVALPCAPPDSAPSGGRPSSPEKAVTAFGNAHYRQSVPHLEKSASVSPLIQRLPHACCVPLPEKKRADCPGAHHKRGLGVQWARRGWRAAGAMWAACNVRGADGVRLGLARRAKPLALERCRSTDQVPVTLILDGSR